MFPTHAGAAPSFSVILGVHNAQSWLELTVHEAVEALAELTSEFDVGVVDHGSVDDTADVAATLASVYPQVHYLGPGQIEAGDAMLRAARAAAGNILVLLPVASRTSLRGLDRLWRELGSRDLVIGKFVQPRGGLKRWTMRLARSLQVAPVNPSSPLEICLLTRDVLKQLKLDELSREQLISNANDRGLTYAEVDLSPIQGDDQAATRHGQPVQRRVHAAPSRVAIGRPNFLGRLKQLAVGE